MHVATTHHLNYSRQESKKHNLQFIFLTPVTFEQSHGHQTYNEKVDPKQGYNHAKCERSYYNNIRATGYSKSFFKRGNMLSPLKMWRKKKGGGGGNWYIHDLLDVTNNRIKFQLKQIRTIKCSVKTDVTLKYNHGPWRWYEWVKLNEYYHHLKSDIYHIYSVRKNCNLTVFDTHGHSAAKLAWPNTDHYILHK